MPTNDIADLIAFNMLDDVQEKQRLLAETNITDRVNRVIRAVENLEVTEPAVSVIMPISLDHQAYLGDRVELIAAEKAGIMKPGAPCIIAQPPKRSGSRT